MNIEKLASSVAARLQAATAAGAVPGVIVGVTDREQTRYEQGFGVRALDSAQAMSTDSVVWIASMTKAVTSVAAMQLIERGLVGLDAPAAQWLPALAEVPVLAGWSADGQPQLRPAARPITVRHLLTHTAGFAYDFWNADIERYMNVAKLPGIISCSRAALTTPLVADPGERWEYGIGVDWLGLLVEAVSGQKLGQYLATNVLQPIGMHDTAFAIRPDMRARLAKIHARTPDGLVATDTELPQSPEFEMGGGGLYGTLGDYLKFTRMILNDGQAEGGRVLSKETVELMAAPAIGALEVPLVRSVQPQTSNDFEVCPGVPTTWGLGFAINKQTMPSGRSAGSLAWAGLANSYYWIDRSRGIAGVYLTQILPFADVESLPLYADFERLTYAAMA